MKINEFSKKIAIITPTLLIKGGTQHQLLQLALECQKNGDPYEIFTFAYFPSETYPEFSKLKVTSVFTLSPNSFLVRTLRYMKADLQLFFLFLSFLLEFKFLQLFYKKEFDVLNPHDWFGSWIAVDVKRKFKLPSKIVTMLNDMPPFAYDKHYIRKNMLQALDANKQQDVDTIVVLDRNMENRALAYYGKTSKIELVRSGIEINTFLNFKVNRRNVRDSLGVRDDEFLFVCASVPAPNRRFEDAIISMKSIPFKSKLLIIGDLEFSKKYGNYLRSLVSDLQLEDKVLFISKFLPSQERNAYIASADSYIFPNENQTWGLGVIEAMALGVPCIVSNGAGVHEVLTHEVNALIYAVSNREELIICMNKIRNLKALRHTLTTNAKHLVANNYSWKKYKDSLYSIFFP